MNFAMYRFLLWIDSPFFLFRNRCLILYW